MVLCAPWADYFINKKNIYQSIDNKTKTNYCLNDLYPSLNSCEGLNQWAFVPFGKTLPYTTSNLNNSSNCLESNQCIDGNS